MSKYQEKNAILIILKIYVEKVENTVMNSCYCLSKCYSAILVKVTGSNPEMFSNNCFAHLITKYVEP